MEKDQFTRLSGTVHQAVTISDRPQPHTCPAEVANRRAGILIACFRKGEAAEPEIYLAAVVSVLCCYPEQVVYRVTDPRVGLPGISKWLPTVAEVRSACEVEMIPAREEEARRVRRERAAAIVGGINRSQVVKGDMERLKAMYGGHGRPEPGKSAEQLAAEYAARPVRLSEAAIQSLDPQED